MPNIRFGDIDFSGDGAYIWGAGQYSAPSRSVDFIEVPGRNGDLLIDNGNYNNTKAYFDVVITGNVEENTNRLKYLLYSQKGYQRLYDSDLKGFYRMACFNSGFEIMSNDGGVVRIEFDCKPFKYDIVGEDPIIIETTNEYVPINNPYFTDARPIVKIIGVGGDYVISDGFIRINSTDLTVDRENAYGMIIDTDLQYAYYEGYNEMVSANHLIGTADFSLHPGENDIMIGGCITGIEITPRWVTI